MKSEEIKRVIEAILFVSEKPLPLEEIKNVVEEKDSNLVRGIIQELKSEYIQQNRSFDIKEVAGGYQMITKPEFSAWLKKLYKTRFTEKLSGPALETLAIIAYKQPLTRAEMEAIRGVNVDGVLKTLLDRGLIRVAGRKDVIGRPIIYGTTKRFLEYFGLNSLEELPSLREFTEQDLSDEQIQQRISKNLYQRQLVDKEEQNAAVENKVPENTAENKEPENKEVENKGVENEGTQEPAQEG